jgi:hypothetical protein
MKKMFATYQNGQETVVFNLPDIVEGDVSRQPSQEEYQQEAQKIGITELAFKTASELDALFNTDKLKVLRQIAAIETQISPRRLREAVISEQGKTWLTAKEAEIQALRAKITGS